MTLHEPIFDKDYWRERLHTPMPCPHHAICICNDVEWAAIAETHRNILATTIKETDNILDLGCGMGRLLTLLPKSWKGSYLGIDLSPDFIDIAREEHPKHDFQVRDFRDLSCFTDKQFDYVIAISIKLMVQQHINEETWSLIETQVQRIAKNVIYLEYDLKDPSEAKE